MLIVAGPPEPKSFRYCTLIAAGSPKRETRLGRKGGPHPGPGSATLTMTGRGRCCVSYAGKPDRNPRMNGANATGDDSSKNAGTKSLYKEII